MACAEWHFHEGFLNRRGYYSEDTSIRDSRFAGKAKEQTLLPDWLPNFTTNDCRGANIKDAPIMAKIIMR